MKTKSIKSNFGSDCVVRDLPPALLKAAQTVIDVIHSVENRCMAADGPVTPTHQEITDAELREMYEAAKAALSINGTKGTQ